MKDPKAQALISRYNKLEAETHVWWKSHWKEVSDYVFHNYDDVYRTQTPGEKKQNALIYDTTALSSGKLLASGLHSMLTNPSLPFFGLTTGVEELDKDEAVRDWLQKASAAMHDVLNGSNFQTEIHEVYLALAGFGTSVCFMEEDDQDIIRFHTLPVYYASMDESYKGAIDTVMTSYKWSLRKVIQKFGKEALPKEWMASQMDKNLDKQYCVVHAVYPREDIKLGEDGKALPGPKNMKFASIYMLKEIGHIIKESGFNEFPYLVPRWLKLPGEKFGRSPTMDALPDIKMINAMTRTVIEGGQLSIRPPLQREDDGVNQIINFTPGAVNVVRPGSKGITPINTGANPLIGEELMNPIKERIKNHYFLNQLQLAENNPQMTATEVIQRTDEKLRMLAPILARQHHEILKPLVDRLFGVMLRKSLFPAKIPDKLRGKTIQVQYSSMIARAQKSVNAEVVTRVFGILSPLIQMKPDILDNFNLDETAIDVSNILGYKQSNMNNRDKVEQTRQGRIQAAQEQAELEKAQVSADVAQKTASIL
jgi:hypothetical protein